ncbi:MAG: 3-oxoacyl-ACP reductase FabG, partial [Candidatus Eiseniibacteriota bacterium]
MSLTMELGLQGKVALVTGGATGIGAAVALALSREGCDVAIVDRAVAEPTAGEIRRTGRRALAIEADVRDHAAAAAVVARVVNDLGRLDILVCNAGITADASLARMTEQQWDDVIEVNLKGCFNYTHAAARVFREQKSGRIVNLSSINGLRGKFGQANYAASKAGVVALSKTAARELGRFNVTVNAVAPGMVLTEMTRSLPAEALERAQGETALGRLAEPGDVADTVVFLCSERARHITG